jgi:hypothetical protein
MSEQNKLYCELKGGFGNQLFMIFNLISLAKDYEIDFQLSYNKKYYHEYSNTNNVVRNSPEKYFIFKNLTFIKNDCAYIEKINEPFFEYKKIIIEHNKNYLLNGYYQSYKYFYHNKNEIKKYLCPNYSLINDIKNKFKSLNKQIVAVHIRLGDYIQKKEIHSIVPEEYYRFMMSKFNTNEYQIILFSDETQTAHEILKKFEINFIDANDFYLNDEDQFYMLCLSDVIISSNSTFPLTSYFINDIFNFKENNVYFFYEKWFGVNGPQYNINDIIPSSVDCRIISSDEIFSIDYNKKIKICLLILTCDNNIDQFNILKTSFLNTFCYDYFVIKADKNISNSFVGDNNNTLFVNCDECYENLPKKMLLAYEFLYKNYDYDYFLKMDDTGLINQNILDHFVKNKFYYFHYIGKRAGTEHVDKKWHFGKCKNNELNITEYNGDYNGPWCGGGFGYILSKHSVSLFLKNNNYEHIWNELYEDKAFGDVLRKENILGSFEYNNYLKISENKNKNENEQYLFLSEH